MRYNPGLSILFILMFGAFLITMVVIQVIPFWRILRRIGFAPPLALLAALPGGAIVLTYVIAFSRWPTAEPVPLPARPLCPRCGSSVSGAFCTNCGNALTS